MKFLILKQSNIKVIKKQKLFIIFYGPLGFNIINFENPFFVTKKKEFMKIVFIKHTHAFYKNLLLTVRKNIFVGFKMYLESIGTGYKITSIDKDLIRFDLGFSHPVFFKIPADIKINIYKNKILKIFGINLTNLTQTASYLKSFKKPEPYKGKGLRYLKELIKIKQGKKKKK